MRDRVSQLVKQRDGCPMYQWKLNQIPDNVDLLKDLVKRRLLVLTPPQDYDDNYVIGYAKQNNGCILSNDMYRDFINGVNAKDKSWLELHLITYTFAGDEFLPNPAFKMPLRGEYDAPQRSSPGGVDAPQRSSAGGVDTVAIIGASDRGYNFLALQQFFSQFPGFVAGKEYKKIGGGFFKYTSHAFAARHWASKASKYTCYHSKKEHGYSSDNYSWKWSTRYCF